MIGHRLASNVGVKGFAVSVGFWVLAGRVECVRFWQVLLCFEPMTQRSYRLLQGAFATEGRRQRGDARSLFTAIPPFSPARSRADRLDAQAARAGATTPSQRVCGCRPGEVSCRRTVGIRRFVRHGQTLAWAFAAPALSGPPPPALARDCPPALRGNRAPSRLRQRRPLGALPFPTSKSVCANS